MQKQCWSYKSDRLMCLSSIISRTCFCIRCSCKRWNQCHSQYATGKSPWSSNLFCYQPLITTRWRKNIFYSVMWCLNVCLDSVICLSTHTYTGSTNLMPVEGGLCVGLEKWWWGSVKKLEKRIFRVNLFKTHYMHEINS